MKKKGGLSETLVSAVLMLIMIGVVLGIIQANGIGSVDEAIDKAKSTASHYAECIPAGDCGLLAILEDVKPSDLVVPGVVNPDTPTDSNGRDLIFNIPYEERSTSRDNNGYRGPAEGEPYVNDVGVVKKELVETMLDNITIDDSKGSNDEASEEYSRSEWKHWVSRDSSCWSVREEVLYRDAVPGTVMLLNKQLKVTENVEDACAIGFLETKRGKRRINTDSAGEWIDPYSGSVITSPSDLDIDHVVPLSYAHKYGGQDWTTKQKEVFANDLDNLLATSAKENRSKGNKGPSDYLPKSLYKCQYAKTFTSVVYKYDLRIPESDKKELSKLVRVCEH